MANQNPLKPKKKRLPRLKKVNVDEVHKKLLNILQREAHHLFTMSVVTKLDKDESQSLVNYLKLLNQLKKDDTIDLDKLTDEELEKIVSKK